MDRKNKILVASILVLLMIVSVPSVLAYFSTYTSAKGTKVISMRNETEMTETVDGNIKTVQIKASTNSSPVFVRVKAFNPDFVNLEVSEDPNEGKWSKNGEFYYYSLPIAAGESTTKLNFKVTTPGVNPKPGDVFNVVIVYESTLQYYGEDWSGVTGGGE